MRAELSKRKREQGWWNEKGGRVGKRLQRHFTYNSGMPARIIMKLVLNYKGIQRHQWWDYLWEGSSM